MSLNLYARLGKKGNAFQSKLKERPAPLGDCHRGDYGLIDKTILGANATLPGDPRCLVRPPSIDATLIDAPPHGSLTVYTASGEQRYMLADYFTEGNMVRKRARWLRLYDRTQGNIEMIKAEYARQQRAFKLWYSLNEIRKWLNYYEQKFADNKQADHLRHGWNHNEANFYIDCGPVLSANKQRDATAEHIPKIAYIADLDNVHLSFRYIDNSDDKKRRVHHFIIITDKQNMSAILRRYGKNFWQEDDGNEHVYFLPAHALAGLNDLKPFCRSYWRVNTEEVSDLSVAHITRRKEPMLRETESRLNSMSRGLAYLGSRQGRYITALLYTLLQREGLTNKVQRSPKMPHESHLRVALKEAHDRKQLYNAAELAGLDENDRWSVEPKQFPRRGLLGFRTVKPASV